MSAALNHHMKPESDRVVTIARRAGQWPPPHRCEACGATEGTIVWHHHDYAHPVDVIGLCTSCHSRVHAGIIPEPRTGRLYARNKKTQVNVRLDADQITAIDATGTDRSSWLRQAAAEKTERDAGGNPARVALQALVWQLIELALFYDLISPVELLTEARKYTDDT